MKLKDTKLEAKKIRETFVDRNATKTTRLKFGWPESLKEVGSCEAVMYSSDKWRTDGKLVDYKHVAEGPQKLAVVPGLIKDEDGYPLKTAGSDVKLGGSMPDSIAALAHLLGIQCRLYKRSGGKLALPKGDEGLFQLDLKGCMLGAAKHPDTKQTFLVIYSEEDGVLGVITGSKLDVLKDGIVG
jgi:hypothetical protein